MPKSNDANIEVITSIITSVIGWLVIVAIGFVTTYYGAFVLRQMWEWFVVPAGYAALSVPLSIGVFLIVGFLKAKMTDNNADSDDNTSAVSKGIAKIVAYAVFITLSWGSAAIWHFWLL